MASAGNSFCRSANGLANRRRSPHYTRKKEFFIRKAIGWVLRELSKKDPGYVIEWTGRHLAEMSGVTFREAVRRLPEPDAARLRASR